MDFDGFDKLTLVDYKDKVACILFTGGCDFRCPFCHNSSLVLLDAPRNSVPFKTIMAYLRKRKGILDGVVVSGGEPTMMPDLREKLIAIKKLGYDIKLDTNGTNPDILIGLVEDKLVDYVAMDIKNALKDYGPITGILNPPVERIEKSIGFLLSNKVDYEFRTTLVEEYHDEEKIKKLGEAIAGARFLYLQKFIDNENCIKRGLHEVTLEEAQKFKKILENYVDDVELRGYF
jgi:pyruvate formate lyase activating enzyme